MSFLMLSAISLVAISFKSFICLHLSGHGFCHLFLNLVDLLLLSIRGLPNLIVAFFSKTDTKEAKKLPTGSLDINMSFNHGLPFFDHGAHFVPGKIHAMKIRQFLP